MTRPPQEGDIYGVYATVNDMDESAQADPSAFGLFAPSTADSGKQFGMMVLE